MKLTSEEHRIYDLALVRAKQYLTAEAAMLDSVMEIDRTKLYKKFGEEFLTPFCVKHFRISVDVAATFVRVARKSLAVPELKLAVENGELDITKAKTIASVVTPENVAAWTEKAANLSKAKLEYEVVKVNPKASKPEKAKPVGDNRNRIECEVNDEIFAQFQRAVDLASQSLGESAGVAETLKEMLSCYLQHRDPIEKAKRAEARKSSSARKTDCSPKQSQDGLQKQRQDQSQKQSRDQSQKQSRDQSQQQSRDRSQQQSRDRSRRAREPISASAIHAVNLRDQRKCQQKLPDGSVCGQTRWVHIHHIIEVAKGGSNRPENLVTLCSHHHRQLHPQYPRDKLQSERACRLGPDGTKAS